MKKFLSAALVSASCVIAGAFVGLCAISALGSPKFIANIPDAGSLVPSGVKLAIQCKYDACFHTTSADGGNSIGPSADCSKDQMIAADQALNGTGQNVADTTINFDNPTDTRLVVAGTDGGAPLCRVYQQTSLPGVIR